MNTRAVIFDLGGVLVKTEPQRLIQSVAQDCGQSEQQVARVLGDATLAEAFELGRLGAKEFFETMAARLKLSWDFARFVRVWNSIIIDENRDTTWLLSRLRQRYRLVVLTNTNVLHDEHIRRTWPVFHEVHHWIASYQVGLRKPEPAIYELALRQAEVSPAAAVYVDDRHENVAVAQQLGLTAVHVTDGLPLEQEFHALGLHV